MIYLDEKIVMDWIYTSVRNSSNSYIQICGERRDVPQDNVEAFLVDLQKPKDEYRDENILNANETALFYHLLP